MAKVTAIILGAGSGERMGHVDKVFLPLLDVPLIVHTLRPFQNCAAVDSVVLVLQADSVARGRELAEQFKMEKVTAVVAGGTTRSESALIGLEQASQADFVVIHDGARPCLDTALIELGLDAAQETGAAIAAVPVQDTVKRVGGDGHIQETVSREGLWAAQTPQVFQRDLLERAHRLAAAPTTDDSALVEALGHRVALFVGSPTNIKVTTPGDFEMAEAILSYRADNAHRHRV